MGFTLHHAAKGQPTRNEHDMFSTEHAAVNKRKRVPTSMPKIWGQPLDELIVVSFNAFGQPNDKNWRLMPRCYKDEMLKTIKTKFSLQPGQESYILKLINKKWKSWKSLVKNLILDPDAPHEQLKNVLDRVDEDQLGALMKQWMSNESKGICEKNKQARAQLKLFHLMGKKSFALLREIMKEKLGRYPTRAELFAGCYFKEDNSDINSVVKNAIDEMEQLEEQDSQSSNTEDVFLKFDAFAKVMGPDKNGHVRMFDLGVTHADVYGIIPSRDACYRMAMEYKEKYDALK